MENTNENSIVKAGLILALAIAGFFGYLYFKEKQENDSMSKTIDAKTAEIIETNSKLDSLARELDLKMEEIEALGGRIDELELLKINLEKDKSDLLSSNSVNIQLYTNKIRNYEKILAQKDQELQKLREENKRLYGENTQLNQSNAQLNSANKKLSVEKDLLRDTVRIYETENQDLKEKVNIAAAIRPHAYIITAINRRGKEREGEEFKVKRVDRIKVEFKLADNPLTKKDNKIIYMRLLDPLGNVISDMATGSGTFSFGGKETVFTSRQTIAYTNTNQTVTFVYDRDKKYEKGEYKVELYCEGFRVGQTHFKIK